MRAFVSLALVALGLTLAFCAFAALHQRTAAALDRNAQMARDLVQLVERRAPAR